MCDLKIISFNINNDYRNIQDKLECVLNLLEEYKPNILGLQEVIPELYNLLKNSISLLPNYKISNSLLNQGFFNVIITNSGSCDSDVVYYPFINGFMNRGFLVQKIKQNNNSICVVNTHLESGHMNSLIRNKQCIEIINNYTEKCNNDNDIKNVIVFGDMNFTNIDEHFHNLYYLEPKEKDIYTYDSKYNIEAVKPYRNNLDRFYLHGCKNIFNTTYNTIILKNVSVSDHFPILLNIMYIS
jgi:endonuclease/exonuclease/phosphatase family metal-dependent hydrolase